MSSRRKAGVANRAVAYSAACLIHAALLAVLLFNYTSRHEKVEAHEAARLDTVNASLINEKDIRDQQAKMTKLEKDRERSKREAEQRERDRLNEIKQQAKNQQEKVDDLKKQQEVEKQKTEKLENERQTIALKKKKEEDERKKKELAEKKRLQKIEVQRIAKQKEVDRLQREEQLFKERQRLQALLADEEAEQQRRAAEQIAKERTAMIQSQYSAKIQGSVKRFWRVAPGTEVNWKAKVNIKLSPRGEVISVDVIESNGSPEFYQSLRAAITQASPLPIATAEEDLEAHTKLQNLNITFTPY